MVSTHSPEAKDADIDTEAGEATIDDLIGQMNHRQEQ